MRVFKRNRICILMIILLSVSLLYGCQTVTTTVESTLKITFLKVGKADAIIIEKDRQVMIIDAGEEDDGEEIVSFLHKDGVEKVDYLIISHYDKDHIGGADTLLESIDVLQIILPDYESNSVEYLDFMNIVAEKSYTPLFLNEDYEFTFANCTVTVNPPVSYEHDASADFDNNLSLIVSIEYGDQRFLFTGDAEKQRINEWLNTDPEEYSFVKMPHHGIYNTAMKRLIEETNVSYAVICDSKKNPADQQTLELLDKYQVTVRETKDGNVTVLSDGKRIEVSQK